MTRRRFVLLVAAGSAAYTGVVACASFSASGEPTVSADASADGSADVSAETASEGGPFCASLVPQPTFCLDFDEGDPVGSGFEQTAGDAASIDTRFFVSPPASALVVGSGSTTFMQRQFDESAAGYDVRLKLRIGGEDGGGPPLEQFAIPLRLSTDGCEISLILEGDGSLDATRRDLMPATNIRYPLLRRPTPGVWSAVHLELLRTAGVTRFRLELDGKPALDLTDTLCPTFAGRPMFGIGMIYADGVEARFDDVVFDRK